MKVLAILAVTVSAALGSAGSAFAEEQKRVLVLYAARRDAQIAIVGDRELPRLLARGLPAGLDYYSEYLDLVRSEDPTYQAGFRDYLLVKYSGIRFDVVVAMQDTALDFVEANRDELFPETPVVFVSMTDRRPAVANETGLRAKPQLGATLELATALQPDVRQVYVVTGASNTDKVYEKLAREQLKPFQSRFAVTYLAGLPMRELEGRLATIPPNSMVFFVMVYQDGEGDNFHPLESLERVTRVANAPVYSWVDSAMDRGILGGSLRVQTLQAEEVATLALDVLRGANAGSIPVRTPQLHEAQVDWRQLRRWRIPESRLPAGTRVLFREPTIWSRYQFYVLGALALLVAQSALIAGLLIQRTRRRQAEEQVRGREGELRSSYERIRDLGARLLNAQESERARIARELHDDISQQMALLQIDLELLGGTAQGDAVAMADDAVNRAQDIARSVHELSHRLHPAKLRLMGLVSALKGLQRELSQSGLTVTFTHDPIPATLPAELTLCLFRIAQEALQNAAKHSGTARVAVRLGHAANGLALAVEDEGVGFDVSAGWRRGLGLISMRERLEAFGGTLMIHSAPGAGTRVEATVPLTSHPQSSLIGMAEDRSSSSRSAVATR
jgi:signal transduction histidine kinase